MKRAACLWAFVVLPLVLVGPACDPSASDGASGPVEVCEKVGERCRHSQGKLGVCMALESQDCGKKPCLKCLSQH